ncbi:MAG TPA: hypothetical protein VK564_04380 [Thermodesulfobacteriota bacterium]|nr:hypothetical protein [Thermodesulfobacteriota bacterium]
MTPKLLYYISGHGYGHAVRSLEVINTLCSLGCRLSIKTSVPPFLLEERLSHPVEIRQDKLDVGLHQIDNLRFDLSLTKAGVKELLDSAPLWITQEAAFLKDENFSGVICDIPFIPFAAAEKAGLPAVGISNFSWDWIYSFYGKRDPEWFPLAKVMAEYYEKGELALRLPFHGPMEAFRRVEDIPLVARKSNRGKSEIRKALSLPEDKRIVLIGFSQVDLSKEAFGKINKLSSRYLFLIRSPLQWDSLCFRKIEGIEASFVDLVAAADLVMTKPGYGIVADCLVHGTPMIYSDRGEFPEYPILVEGIKAFLPSCYMPQEDLYNGEWLPYLETVESQSFQSRPIAMNGAEVAGNRLLELFKDRD